MLLFQAIRIAGVAVLLSTSTACSTLGAFSDPLVTSASSDPAESMMKKLEAGSCTNPKDPDICLHESTDIANQLAGVLTSYSGALMDGADGLGDLLAFLGVGGAAAAAFDAAENGLKGVGLGLVSVEGVRKYYDPRGTAQLYASASQRIRCAVRIANGLQESRSMLGEDERSSWLSSFSTYEFAYDASTHSPALAALASSNLTSSAGQLVLFRARETLGQIKALVAGEVGGLPPWRALNQSILEIVGSLNDAILEKAKNRPIPDGKSLLDGADAWQKQLRAGKDSLTANGQMNVMAASLLLGTDIAAGDPFNPTNLLAVRVVEDELHAAIQAAEEPVQGAVACANSDSQ